MIVVDASVLLPALVDAGGSGSLARAVLARDDQRHAPSLIDAEVLAGLRGWWLAGRIRADHASEVVADLAAYPIGRHPLPPLLRRAFELRGNVSAYDALYVALAEAFGAPLVTADARLAVAPGVLCEVRLLRA